MKFERYLNQHDAAILGRLAERLLRVRDLKFNPGEQLTDIISNAILLSANTRKNDCVMLGARVDYCTLGSEEEHAVTIVAPEEADQASGMVSVLAPIGMALIGRKVGSVVEIQLPFGQTEFVRIMDVEKASTTAKASRNNLVQQATA
ncbi:MAG: GreA/GreB family elongation factor [Proteobacteria bacterium]|nr:GreA/GreB family elongation factor [Pseudomonadota bacterium]